MTTLRLICVETDYGAAANVGGPVYVEHKTFDIPCPPEVAEWLSQVRKYQTRAITAVEFREDQP